MSRPARWLVTTPALGLLALGSAGIWFHFAQRQYLQQVASANLLIIAQAKLDRIVAWRTERLGDAAVLQESPFFIRTVARWMAGRQPEIAAEILTRLRSAKVHYGYDDVHLVDRAGRILLATGAHTGGLDSAEAGALRVALRDRHPTMGDMLDSAVDPIPRLAVVAPLFTSSGRTSPPIGAVVHVVDARRSLFRLVVSWPSPSLSAEARLVRRDGDSVLFLTPQRFESGGAPIHRIALSRRNVPAVMAVLGTKGVVRGVDYRGVRVISALRAVPGTPWFLVVKVDEAEALAVWRTRVALVFAVLLGLVLVAGATALALGQRSSKAHYRKMYEAEAALSASETRFRTLVEEAGADFALLDAEGRYVDATTACCQQLGYTREELLGLSISDIDSLFSPQQFGADFQSLVGKPPLTYLSTHRRKDGATFPVEVTLSVVRIGGVPQALALARDVSDRMRAVETLREKEQELRVLFEELPVGVSLLDQNRKITYANQRLEEILGLSRDDLLQGKHQERRYLRSDGTPMPPEEFASARAFQEQRPIHAVETGIVAEDGRTIWTSVSAAPYPVAHKGVLVATADITARKRAEQALEDSESRYRLLVENASEAILVAQDGRLEFVNRMAAELNGRSEQELLSRPFIEFIHPDDRASVMESYLRRLRGDALQPRYVFRLMAPDGRIRWVEIGAVLIDWEGKPATLNFLTDITERKRSEEALRTSDTRFRELFNRMSSGVAVYEAIDDGGDFVFRDFNPAAEQIEEVSRNGILGKRVSEVFPGVKAFGLFEVFQRVWQTGEPEYFPGNIYRDEKRLEGWRENWVFKLPTGEVVAIYNEITERKRAEAALRALARHLDSVREEEHTRIARQIHDELGQALTALRLDLTWVGRKLPEGNSALRRRVDAAVALTDEMIAVGHDIVGELRPPILDDLGLVPALEWHAQQVAKRSGVRIQVEGAAGERVVADDLAVSAYRIVQEALANVVRHAQAKHVRVRLGEQDGGLTIEIRDDGQGFPEDAASNPRSFGITGMRERAASHGGTLVITGSLGAGTTVRVTFPPERRKVPRAPR